jgi:hypothetical protein
MQLREHWLAVDSLVDSVVDIHYSGFNKSLQNYSQIAMIITISGNHETVLAKFNAWPLLSDYRDDA